ncbi:MAG: hypothetical protein AMXMBFR84_17920 [Candidatus Hydrogenedentota bacterium]
MRDGTITEWNDQRGFGFITLTDNPRKVFFHISDVVTKRNRPAVGLAVTCEVVASDRGDKAVGVAVCSTHGSPRIGVGGWVAAVAIAAGLAALAYAIDEARLPVLTLLAIGGMSALAFTLYRDDKAKAQSGLWRIPESTLHLVALLGGWPGALIAQRVLRHKNRKLSFQLTFWVTVILNIAALAALANIGLENILQQLQ